MGVCSSKPTSKTKLSGDNIPANDDDSGDRKIKKSPFFPFYTPSPAHYLFSKMSSPAVNNGSKLTTPRKFFRPPPSPAKHIKALRRRVSGKVEKEVAREDVGEVELDKSFGFLKHFGSKYEMGEEVGRGHFGHTCKAKVKKGEFKGKDVAVKVIPKSKMTTAISIEDVRREVKILKALSGHENLVKFYDAYEDHDNVYVVMELCEGGELLDRILSRGGKFTEDDAKAVLIQILNVVAFCHLQGVVHRDLKPETEVKGSILTPHKAGGPFLPLVEPEAASLPLVGVGLSTSQPPPYTVEDGIGTHNPWKTNFLFTSKDDNSQLKAIDFGLSDFLKPDERLNDIVGSAYYVVPEVLHRSYSTEADVWSIGVIAYILLCGSRPFWARTESGIFRAVLKAHPNFNEVPWPTLSSKAKDFVKRLLNKDPRRRMTAAQRLSHPWIRHTNDVKVPLDVSILRHMKGYMRSSPLRKAAIRALVKTLSTDELYFLKEQFSLLEPSKNGSISMDNIKAALIKHATDAMKESRIHDFLTSLNALQYRRMEFDEFSAAALSVYQLEAHDRWEEHARCAYEIFDKDGNRAIMIEELASELGLGPSVPVHSVLNDWIRHTDGKLSFLGFVKLLHGVSSRTLAKAR
ncbi:CDPK-related kinase 5 [Tanacetum coccineum]|uniref:CDPK-related kinase 5 n=1 Tax=Tanacetum coccineum TaxID=301880 RepID=A0ABQ5H569_9ASTR